MQCIPGNVVCTGMWQVTRTPYPLGVFSLVGKLYEYLNNMRQDVMQLAKNETQIKCLGVRKNIFLRGVKHEKKKGHEEIIRSSFGFG